MDLAQLTTMNLAQIVILIQLILMSTAQTSLLLNSVQTIIPIDFTPLLKAPKSSRMRLALQHDPDKRKHLKPTASSPPVGP
jgi:hypothetical protein